MWLFISVWHCPAACAAFVVFEWLGTAKSSSRPQRVQQLSSTAGIWNAPLCQPGGDLAGGVHLAHCPSLFSNWYQSLAVHATPVAVLCVPPVPEQVCSMQTFTTALPDQKLSVDACL